MLLEPARRRAAYHSNLTPSAHAREPGARVAAIVAGIVAATMLIVVAGIAMIQRDLTVGPSLIEEADPRRMVQRGIRGHDEV